MGLQQRPGDPKALLTLGMIALQEKQYNTAISRFQTLREIQPEDAAVRYQLAVALLAQGRKTEARAQLEEVLRQVPQYAPAREALQQARSVRPRSRSGSAPTGGVDSGGAMLQPLAHIPRQHRPVLTRHDALEVLVPSVRFLRPPQQVARQVCVKTSNRPLQHHLMLPQAHVSHR